MNGQTTRSQAELIFSKRSDDKTEGLVHQRIPEPQYSLSGQNVGCRASPYFMGGASVFENAKKASCHSLDRSFILCKQP
jgi:hypothetical protein